MSRPVSLRCAYCDQVVLEGAKGFTRGEVRRLQEHLLGCPAALAACSPALPVFAGDEIKKHFRCEPFSAI
jgi:hypothetical protein